jgi:hypothetical protein
MKLDLPLAWTSKSSCSKQRAWPRLGVKHTSNFFCLAQIATRQSALYLWANIPKLPQRNQGASAVLLTVFHIKRLQPIEVGSGESNERKS